VTSLAFLALAVGICLIGTLIVMVVHRRPRQGSEASIEAFARQLEVLGRSAGRPTPDGDRRRSRRRSRGR
jgi:hypothetical protein